MPVLNLLRLYCDTFFMTNSSSHYFSPQSVPATDPAKPIRMKTIRMTVKGHHLEMAAGNGMFSKSAFDDGSRLLIKNILPAIQVLPPGALVCDLGCGWGPIGCFLAAHNPSTPVVMCDINARAAWFARLNAQKNGLPNAFVWCGDGLSAAKNEVFDVVVCNPPIRAGNAVIGVLFDGAHRCLKTGGELWVVIRTSQGAKSWQKKLEAMFGNCETVFIVSGYRILKCEKR